MTNTQRIGAGSSGNHQIQANGDVTAPYARDGAISIGGDNHGIVITSVPNPEEPRYTFDITKKTRIPTPSTLIGVISGLITIAGFITGGLSIEQLIDGFMVGNGFDVMSGPPEACWWLLASALAIVAGAIGLRLYAFLRRNVLWLPKWWIFRGWAGIKEENGTTYPYALRLAMRCPKCKEQKLRFKQTPVNWADHYDRRGNRIKREVTEWKPMAACPRDGTHSIPVSISGNDFNHPLPR